MKNEKLQAIIDNCKHPYARAFFEELFARHDEIVESMNHRGENQVCEELDYVSLNDLNWITNGTMKKNRLMNSMQAHSNATKIAPSHS